MSEVRGPISDVKRHKFSCRVDFNLQISHLDQLTIADLLELGGCPQDEQVAAVLSLLCDALNQGSLCLPLDPETIAARLPGTGPERAGQLVAAFLEKTAKDPFAKLVARPDGYRPLVLVQCPGGPLLYFHKYYEAERLLRDGLTRLSRATLPALGDPTLLDALRGEDLVLRGADGPLDRDAAQENAVVQALQGPLTLVCGGPGTGKTTLLVTLLRCLVRSGICWDRIALAAPTGRAARRLTEAVVRGIDSVRRAGEQDHFLRRLRGSTLHRLLRFQPSRNAFYHNRSTPLALDVVIVDEVSMVDALLLAGLVEAVDPTVTRLVLVGDKDQLPSVEAGAALADMVAGNSVLAGLPLVELKRSHRAGPNLGALAGTINQGRCLPAAPGNWDQALSMARDEWTLVAAGGPAHWRHGVERWAEAVYLAPATGTRACFKDLVAGAAGPASGDETRMERLTLLFAAIGGGRILTLTREGPYGCKAANAHVAQILCRHLDPWADPDHGLFAGALVMVVRNDYAKGLFNGDVGVVLADGSGGHRVWFPQAEGFAAFPPSTLPPWEPAFAVTVHKSQGSEYDRVLLALGDDPNHPLMTREMLYTGITRARQSLIVYADPAALSAAAGRKLQRFSGLRGN